MGNRLQEMEDRYKAKAAAEKKAIQDKIAELRAKSDAKRQADRTAKEQAEQEAEAARQVAAAERFDREVKVPMLTKWLANGGTKEEFDQAWPELRKQKLTELADRAEKRARAASMERARSIF
jgi:hypothetical protein